MSSKKPNNEVMYIDPAFLAENDGGSYVASTMFSRIFVPAQKVPREILHKYRDDESIQRQLLAEEAIASISIQQPFWSKGTNKREFDTVNVDVFGAICLTGDRHCLDSIIAHGGLIYSEPDQPLTLRQAAEACQLDVDWSRYSDQSEIDKPLLNQGVYFHIQVAPLLKAMGLTSGKANRLSLLSRLKRLSLMTLELSFESEGKRIPHRAKRFSLIDKNYHLLLNRNVIRNHAGISDDTFTDLIISVSNFYVSSLREDGQISRERFLNDYPHLLGRGGLEDLFKYFDSHTRRYIHGKFLGDLIAAYYREKIDTYGVNLFEKTSLLMNQVVDRQHKLKKHFQFVLTPDDNPNSRYRGQDYRVYWLPKLEGREV